MTEPNLLALLLEKTPNIDRVCEIFDTDLIPEAVKDLNSDFSPRRLTKLPRLTEPLPTDKRQLSSYRTRMGTILEYALSTKIQAILDHRYDRKLLLTFAVAHEYPDFYLRDAELVPKLRIEMKAVDADSDEQAARFDVPTASINPSRDLILFIGWEWKDSVEPAGEYPNIFAYIVIPAAEIAKERDKRLYAIGGNITDGAVLVPSTKKQGKMVPDPGNYGKLLRIIGKQRRGVTELSEHMRRFEAFLRTVDEHTVRRGARKRARFK